MGDYISREAAIRFFDGWVDDLDKQINDSVNCPHLRSDYKVCKTQLLDCIHAIKEMTAADVRPVVRGRWVEVSRPTQSKKAAICECSVCGDTIWVYDGQREWKYCPNCGADMRESNLDATKGDGHD